MTFLSFAWPMLSSCSQGIVKTIYYSRYFPTLRCIEWKKVFIFLLELKLLFWLICYFNLQLLIFLPFYSQKIYCFSMTFNDQHFNFMTFQTWKMKFIIKFHDFPAFSSPIQTLYVTTDKWHWTKQQVNYQKSI